MLAAVRGLCAIAFLLATALAACQNPEWAIVVDAPGRIAHARQIIETPTGILLVCGSFNDDSSQTRLLRLSPTVELMSSHRLWPSMRRLGVFDVASLPGSAQHDLMGAAQDTMGQWSIARYRVDDAGTPIDSLLTPLPNTSWISFDNALRLASGRLVVPAARVGFGEQGFNHLTLAMFEADGSLSSSADFQNPVSMILTRGIAEIAPDTFMLATDAGFAELDQWWSWGTYTEFSTDLNPIAGFGQLIVTGAAEPLFSNSLWSAHSVHPLPSGDLILSGRYASHGAVARTSRQGQLQGVFLPDPAPFSNYPAVLGGVTMLANGKLLFTFHERLVTNINDPYMPDQPNVVKVYHLDTLLNLECVLTLDGNTDYVHHWVNRTIATSDGGFVLVGGRLDLNEQPPQWRYWAQKYPAGACFAGIVDQSLPGQIRVFPNPGSFEVNFNLNGPERAAYVELLDLQGRVVEITRFRMGQARLEVRDRPAGIYAYRIIAGDGTPISAGRWVKE